ncbi:MAG: MBL fold metallo-hydrolase [Opitutales bacterium]
MLKAILWGCCGSLPSPTPSFKIRQRIAAALWAARNEQFQAESDVDRFLDTLPHSATGSYKGNTSCVEIDANEQEVILCDAGTGIRNYALSLGKKTPPRTYHIFISHLHWDHIQGFPFFTPAFEPGNRIVFHSFHSEIETCLRKQMEPPFFPVPFESMQAKIEFDIRSEGASFDLGSVHIDAIKQHHPGDSWGYRFEKNGKRIVYSSDSEHGPEARETNYPFVDFFKDADVLIIDGQYTQEEAQNGKRDWGHSDHITAIELAARARARQVVIFHHEPRYSDDKIEAIHAEALKHQNQLARGTGHAPGQIFPEKFILGYDGLTIEA